MKTMYKIYSRGYTIKEREGILLLSDTDLVNLI